MTPAVVIVVAVCAVAGLLIGTRKGHPVWGFFLGLLLSVIGVAIIAVTKPEPAQAGQHREARREPGGPPPPTG